MRTLEALAIDGGAAIRTTPPPRRLIVGTEERQAVLALLDREMEQGGGFDRYGGTEVDAFEAEFAAHVGTTYATAVSSGTAAIHSARRLAAGAILGSHLAAYYRSRGGDANCLARVRASFC